MADTDDMMMLNLSSGGPGPTQRREKGTKRERVQKKRQERRDREQHIERIKSRTATSGDDKPSRKTESASPQKRKHDDDNYDAPAPKRHQPSLFYNNPEIPKISSSSVEAVNEKVFSGDSFENLGLHSFMVSNLEASLKITQATSVQKRTIPLMLAGKDVLVKSQTGSGKTLAYAIPIIQELQEYRPKLQRSDGTHALVIVPTRELALQSFSAFQSLVKPFTWLVPGSLMGGEKKKSEKARLRKGLTVVVSTPGRLIDHIENTKNLDLSRIKWLVIDEADRLLDMGFEKDVSAIVKALAEKGPQDRKTALLSATLSSGVERLAGMSLRSPETVDITADNKTSADGATSDGGMTFATPENLRHHCVIVPSKLRLVSLAAFILWKCKMAAKCTKMLVFMSTQDAVDFHFKLFNNTLFAGDDDDNEGSDSNVLYKIHGDMPQKERTKIFNEFRKVPSGVLFCTDVAARGLDLPQVRWIVQYTPPGSSRDYIHRVGRTARIGSRGNGLLFLSPSETEFTETLAEHNINLVEVQMNDILKTLLMEKSQLEYLWQDNPLPNTVEEAASFLQSNFTEHVEGNKDSRNLARKACQSFIGSYAAHPVSVKHIFHYKKLHLGHVATSFALLDAPTKIGGLVSTHGKKEDNKAQPQKTKRPGSLPSSMHRSNKSEFVSGLSKKSTSAIPNAARGTKKMRKKAKAN